MAKRTEKSGCQSSRDRNSARVILVTLSYRLAAELVILIDIVIAIIGLREQLGSMESRSA